MTVSAQNSQCLSKKVHSVVLAGDRFSMALAVLLLLVVQPNFAEDKPVLHAVTAEDNYPYNYKSNGVIQGVGFEVATTLAERAGYSLIVETLPWTRALKTAEIEPNVLIFSIARIPERENLYYWIGPFASSEIWLYKLASRRDIKLNTLEEVKNYLVGDTRDDATVPLLKQLGIKVDTAPTDASSCKKFKIGRVDLVPVDSDAISAFAAFCGLDAEQMEKTILLVEASDLYIGVGRKTSPDIVARLSKEFDAMKKDGTLQKIKAKWNLLLPHSK